MRALLIYLFPISLGFIFSINLQPPSNVLKTIDNYTKHRKKNIYIKAFILAYSGQST